ncbi:hypothetical protein [Spirosoma gilvum]
MFIYISCITTQGELRRFSFRSPSLEVGFNVLSAIQKKGDKLLSIRIVDGQRAMVLPPEVFDGQDFSQPLLALERQWKLILTSRSES